MKSMVICTNRQRGQMCRDKTRNTVIVLHVPVFVSSKRLILVYKMDKAGYGMF